MASDRLVSCCTAFLACGLSEPGPDQAISRHHAHYRGGRYFGTTRGLRRPATPSDVAIPQYQIRCSNPHLDTARNGFPTRWSACIVNIMACTNGTSDMRTHTQAPREKCPHQDRPRSNRNQLSP